MDVIEFRTLGTLDLRRADGSELHSLLAQPKRVALLAYLCLAKPRGFHRRDTLLGLFWPDADQTHARTSLRNALHVLRHSLGETALHSRGDEEIAVNFDAVWCDAVAFEEQSATEEIDGALELYLGDFLSGFFLDDVPAFERWLEGERTGLRATAARAARVAAERRELEGNLTGAISLARRSVELTDTDERAVRRLVELLARVGDRAGALQAYENFERHLATEFDAEPSAETRTIADRVRSYPSAPAKANASKTNTPVGATPPPELSVPGYLMERELGRGGTSTVFLARDLKHDRPVAIKILRPDIAAVLGTDRFLSEIAIAARLHHPHILPLLDSGKANRLPYYVMPYVEGESLRGRLRREKFLPIQDAIRIATEVADALAYAHGHGIVHRDIKPDNILLENGHALITDFGIARAISEAGGERLTETGLAVGTAAYMSPEQADSAGEIDARADIYALGCVLYEMLTGDPPFVGSSAQAILARKATEPAPRLRAVRETITPSLESSILKALSRVPADRFSTANEFAHSLAKQRPATRSEIAVSSAPDKTSHDRLESAERSSEVPPNPLSPQSGAAGTLDGERTRRRLKMVLYGAIPILILTTAAAIWGWMRPEPSKPVVRYTLVIDSTEAIAGGGVESGRIALSPDGSRVAYVGGARWQLMIRQANQLRATVVRETEGVATPFFSPDGSRVGFLEMRRMRIVSINGGSPITVSDTLMGFSGASWGPDNFIYADGWGPGGLLRVEARRAATPRGFTHLDTASGEVDHAWPDVLPNGKGVLFTITFNARNGVERGISHAIAVADIPSGKHRVLLDDAMYPRYSTSGHLLYVTTNKRLMVVPFDQNSMKVTGEPTVVAEDVRLGLLGSADLAVSATGTLVYATGAGEGKWEVVWVIRDGKARPVDPDWSSSTLMYPALSPDGKWLAIARSATTEPINIWIKRLDQGPSINLTLEGKENYSPAWTADGTSVTFTSGRAAGPFYLWTKRADGSAPAMLQLRERRNLSFSRWSPDGKWLVFQTDPAQSGAGDILGLRPGIDSAPVPLVATKFTELAPALSPDGRWLAYSSNETGAFEIYVVPFPNTRDAKWAISTSGGIEPLWSHRGSELFYKDSSENLVAAEVKTKPTFSVARTTTLFPGRAFGSSRFGPQFAVASDDRRFLMIRPLETTSPDKLIVVENWFEELKAKSRK